MAATSESGPTKLRWAFVGMAALLTIVLGTSALTSFFGARELADTVVRGQASMLLGTVHRAMPEELGPPTASMLGEALARGEAAGLRWVALVRRSGEVEAEAGRASGAFAIGDVPGPDPMRHGDVVRVAAPPVHPPPPGKAAPPPGKAPPPGARRGPPPRLVIEFESTLGIAMEQRARRDLAFGLAAIAVLWGAAALFWRLAARAADSEARLASQRHLAALGEMSAVVAHELRNPLASLKGNAQLLLERAADDPRLAKKARRVVDEAQRLETLGHGLLEFVRSGRVERRPTELRDVVDEAVATSVAAVDVELEGAPAQWVLDGPRLRQVLTNLLDNAHHAAPGERVSLHGLVRDGELVLQVRDHGPGVPAELRERIFAPFHTGRTRGTGLGLAVARRIVELHRGTITCDDHPEGGAVFTVVLPPAPAESPV